MNVKRILLTGFFMPMTALLVLVSPAMTSSASAEVAYSQYNYGKYCASGSPIRSVRTSKKIVAFTFDDGPWPTNTKAIMSSFEKYNWRATFFMIGNNVKKYPAIARDVVSRGHTVGNHSMTHQYSSSVIVSEMTPTTSLIKNTTGVKTTFFRSPGLTLSSSINSGAFTRGMCNISTNYDLGDWRSPRATASTLCSRFKQSLKPGSIVLLHDGGSHSQTVAAVPCMLSYVKSQGYEVVPLGALLREATTPTVRVYGPDGAAKDAGINNSQLEYASDGGQTVNE